MFKNTLFHQIVRIPVFRHPFSIIISSRTACGNTHFSKDMWQHIQIVCEALPQKIAWLYCKILQSLYSRSTRRYFIRGIPIRLRERRLIHHNRSINVFVCVMVLNVNFQQCSSYIVAVSFIGGRNRSTQKKTTDMSQVTDKLHHIMLY